MYVTNAVVYTNLFFRHTLFGAEPQKAIGRQAETYRQAGRQVSQLTIIHFWLRNAAL